MASKTYYQRMTKLVDSVRAFVLGEVGSKEWLNIHHYLIKLGRQVEFERHSFREKTLKAIFIEHDKLDVVVHEASCVFLWRTHILPYLLEVNPSRTAVSMISNVLYHENVAISLLDNLLFTACDCQALWDCSADLVDYCAKSLIQFISLTRTDTTEPGSGELTGLEQRKRAWIRKIGLRCISIVAFLAVNARFLPLNAAHRMVVIYDVPLLIIELLHQRPWLRRTEAGVQAFMNDQWIDYLGERVVIYEAASWMCLREILLNQSLMEVYSFTDERLKHFEKCYNIMDRNLIIELPKLTNLKNYLHRLVESRDLPESNAVALLLEGESQIHEKLIHEAEQAGGFFEIAKRQKRNFSIQPGEVCNAMRFA